MKKIRIVSDIHGKPLQYLNVVHNADYSVQIGDLAFNYDFLNEVDSAKHKFFGGNHDNYDTIGDYLHNLGNYGEYELNGIKFFFVRGEFSIDWAYRARHEQLTGQKIAWKEEELTLGQMQDCFEWYKKSKPDFVLSHGCPRSVSNIIGNKDILRNFGFDAEKFTTNTSELLELCFQEHQPKLWIFGHYHIKKQVNLNGTKFICLPEFGYCDVNSNLEVMGLKF